jgi:CheY-like chemotaxis protein
MNIAKEILIIDDENDIRIALIEFLEDEGYTLAQAANGQAGLEYLSSNPHPKLILVDYMMPVMGGEEFCLACKNDEQLKAVPIALLSAACVPDNKLREMHLAGVIEKPIDIEKFLAFVDKYCRVAP